MCGPTISAMFFVIGTTLGVVLAVVFGYYLLFKFVFK
jgi:hypothetical protein